MWQLISNIYLNYSSEVLKVFQFIAAIIAIFVFFKLRRIEKRYLFKATWKNTSKKIATYATELLKNKNDSIEIYRLLPEIEATILSTKRIGISEIDRQIKLCEDCLNSSYQKKFKIFQSKTRVMPSQDNIWRLHGELHGLSTAIKNLQSENSWRS